MRASRASLLVALAALTACGDESPAPGLARAFDPAAVEGANLERELVGPEGRAYRLVPTAEAFTALDAHTESAHTRPSMAVENTSSVVANGPTSAPGAKYP